MQNLISVITLAWRAKTRNHGKQTQLTQTDISARTPTPPGDVPAQHAGILTRSMAKVAQLDTPEIHRGDLTPASPEINLDLTVETVADDKAVCDVASLISEDTAVSDIVADDDTSICMSKQEVDDVCDSSDDVMSDDEAGIPDNQPLWWNRMVEDIRTEIRDMTAKLCALPKPD